MLPLSSDGGVHAGNSASVKHRSFRILMRGMEADPHAHKKFRDESYIQRR